MSNFNYITAKEFRETLEKDHGELLACFEAGAWKSAQVIAGSIVECLLVDYLSSSTHPSRPPKDPLKIDLTDAVMICENEKVITDRTADLCSVVRSYRNLIHPGRMVRLGEQPPDKNSATIALALVGMISNEIEKSRRASVGLTGEQILSKLQRDAGSLTILKHLLSEVSESQQERLLLDLIPNAHREATDDDVPFGNEGEVDRLEKAYRIILEGRPTETKDRVAAEFVKVLREGDGKTVTRHSTAFFRPLDIARVQKQHQAMVKEYFLGCIPNVHTEASLRRLEHIENYLLTQDVNKWLDPIVRTIVSPTVRVNVKSAAKEQLLSASSFTNREVDQAILARLKVWSSHFNEQKAEDKVALLDALYTEVDSQNIPF